MYIYCVCYFDSNWYNFNVDIIDLKSVVSYNKILLRFGIMSVKGNSIL